MKNWEHFLTITAEEAGEIIKEAAKCLRFGVNDTNPQEPQGRNNGEKLGWEIDDLTAVAELLRKEMIIPPADPTRIEQKKIRIMRWLEYSRKKGRVDEGERCIFPYDKSRPVGNIHLPRAWNMETERNKSDYRRTICGGIVKTEEMGTAWTPFLSAATCPECVKLYKELFPGATTDHGLQISNWSSDDFARKEASGELGQRPIKEKCVCGHERDNHEVFGRCGSPGCDCKGWTKPGSDF